mmetsp:Transcript_7456/g.9248  ORF Transcript_7456/g.9248 Transcript_7456/m.9248 type:complete len:271 (+) Transcript_7456:174-986(+)
MKSFFNSTTNNSFFKQEQERIESIIKEPLLEYVLQDLPHLQATKEQQDDVWEMIAIKLNTNQFRSVLTSTDNNNKDLDEIATLNGQYIKDVYLKLMSDFLQRVYTINRYSQVFKAEYTRPPAGGQAPIGYATFSLPIREVLTERIDKLLCELFYLKGYDVEVMAKLSKERFEEQQRNDFKTKLSIVAASHMNQDKEVHKESLDGTFDSIEKTHKALEKMKEQLEHLKLDFYEKEFEKKNKKLEQLNKENKRLLELNHELVTELQKLRDLS